MSTIIFKKHLATRKAPVNFKPEDREVFGNAWEKEIPESFITVLHRAWILGDGIFHPASVSFFNQHTHLYKQNISSKLRSFLALRKPVQRIEKAIWITDNLSFNYFHWLLDALPRLMLAKAYRKEYCVFLPEVYRNFPYIEASLRILSATPVYASSPNIRVRELILPSHAAGTGNYNRELVRTLRDQMIGSPGRPFRKIYLSREKSIRRKISNEFHVQELFRTNGFEIHYFEAYPFEEQVALMKETLVLAGLHGAGLANMLFMPEGGSIIEIRNSGDCQNNCYFSLASELGHSYFYHIGKGNKEDTFDAEVEVELDEMKTLLGMLPSGN